MSPALAALLAQPWALELGMFSQVLHVVTRHSEGIRLDPEAIAAAIGRDPASPHPKTADYTVVDGIARIPVQGVLAKWSGQVNGASQPKGTSTEKIQQQLQAALQDPTVRGIVLMVDSPGGSVDGIQATADQIAAADQRKPCVAFIGDNGCSAAYWLASQCRSVICGATARVGSIGVYSAIVDSSVAAHNAGRQVSLLASGPNKGIGTDGTRVSDAQVATARQVIQDLYQVFLGAVAQGRGIAAEDLEAVADGRVLVGAGAVAAGLADRVGTQADAMAAAGAPGPLPDPNGIPTRPDFGLRPAAAVDPAIAAMQTTSRKVLEESLALQAGKRWPPEPEKAPAPPPAVLPAAPTPKAAPGPSGVDLSDPRTWERMWQASAFLRSRFYAGRESFLECMRREPAMRRRALIMCVEDRDPGRI